MNELYQTCATRAESRKPTTREILIASVPQSGAPSLEAPEELTYVDAYVGKGATLDSLLTQMRLLIGRT